MKRGIKTACCLLGCAALTTGANAIVNETPEGNPYHAIVERNVFDLKPPTPAAPPTTVTNTPPPNVKLTGITTILGNKRALFMVQEAPVAGKPQKEESYILTEGQRQGVLEVVEINEKAQNVKIMNDGTLSVLTFETVKLPSAAAGGAPNPLGNMTPPPRMPNFAAPPVNGGYNPQAAMGGASTPGSNLNPAANNGLSSIPTRTLRTQDQPYSMEEQMVMMEAQREANKNNPRFPMLPPTLITPNPQGDGGQQQPGTGRNPTPGFPGLPGAQTR